MFANLTEAVKRRFIQELRNFWSFDPRYRDTLVDNIQGKYAFDERPQMGIVIKGTSATPMQLSADNYQGTVISYCHLTRVFGKPGLSIEWVREDSLAIQKNGGVFPSKRGIYYIEVRREEFPVQGIPSMVAVFYVDPLLDVVDEQPIKITNFRYELRNGACHPGSLRVYLMPGNVPLTDGVDYAANPETGTIEMARSYGSNDFFSVDYRYAVASRGPFLVPPDGSNNEAIPGVVLAFGRRYEDGDVMAIVVGDQREDSALEYGGRWEINLDADVIARDPVAQSEISDKTIMFLFGNLRGNLSAEGIEITQVSMGGESEEMYDETGDDYYYMASISMTVLNDWSIHVPLDRGFTRLLPNTLFAQQAVDALSNEQIAEMRGSPTTVTLVENVNFLQPADPYFRDRTRDYELIR